MQTTAHACSDPGFSVDEIPFSYHGSWFGISPVLAEHRRADDLHLVSHQRGMHPVLRFVPTANGHRAQTTIAATASRLAWTHGAGRVELVYERADTLRVRGDGLGLRIAAANPTLTPFSGPYLYRDPIDGAHVYTLYETGRRYRVTVVAGALAATAGVEALGQAERALQLPDHAPWEIAIEEY